MRDYAVFVGAGASVPAPTNLPAAWTLRTRIARVLQDALPRSAIVRSALDEIAGSDFPLEFLLEVLCSRLSRDSLCSLQPLERCTPNLVHRAIAALAANGRLKNIYTVNFDECIEVALLQAGLVKGSDFLVLTGISPPPTADSGHVLVRKLHGTITEPSTLVGPLARVGQSRNDAQAIRDMLVGETDKTWIFTGYRGADLDLQIALRDVISTGRGLWNSLVERDIEPGILAILRVHGWDVQLVDAVDLFSGILRSEGLSPSVSDPPPAAPASPSEEFADFRRMVRRAPRGRILAVLADVCGHIGRNISKYLISSRFGERSYDGWDPTQAKIDSSLALGRSLSPDVLASFEDRYSGLRALFMRARILADNGECARALTLMEAAIKDLSAAPLPSPDYHAVRYLTFTAELLARQGRGAEGVSLSREAFRRAVGHLQLEGVSVRTEGICLQSLGAHVDAIRCLKSCLPDLIADANGRLIALLALADSLNSVGEPAEASIAILDAERIASSIEHVVRTRELAEVLSHGGTVKGMPL